MPRHIGPLGQLKPVPQEVDVTNWNAFPASPPVPEGVVRLRPNESLRERGRCFKQNIVSGTACLVRKRVGSSCAFDERKEVGVRMMAARDARCCKCWQRGRRSRGREDSAPRTARRLVSSGKAWVFARTVAFGIVAFLEL